ncbi:MFS transporter [Amycolatopsis pithecellobii]|uniref:MFS transporter n=1 Tax=Amycolatopsis pithecellobii TaxID=664692 RepID=A0A6N7Z0P3_9PSEU|nr:MFS transporter [Amycolatopsis pithecellobii]MTD53170.1 MFS transporter [Amycolatopsis pithecellobii]
MAADDVLDRVDPGKLNRKISLRLLPFLGLLMFVAYLDRISLSYAGPYGMNKELGLTATTFGLAAGIFFVGYILLEVPSNVAMYRFGARIWLARIIVTWGVIQILTAFTPNATILYILRFLLGLTEAGFTPGVLLYLTFWFSREYRGRAISRFLFSVMVATVAGAPLSFWLISIGNAGHPFGLTGWRFLILMTGVPAVILGVIAWFYLDDGPQQASWLSPAEKADIQARLDAKPAHTPSSHSVRTVLRRGRVWLLGLCYFSFTYGAFALTFFLPAIVAGFQKQFNVHYSLSQAAWITAIPFAFGGAAQLWFGRHADRKGRPGLHVAVAAVIGVAGGIAATFATNPITLIVCLCLMAIGITGATPLILVVAAELYGGVAAAAAVALVNTIGVTAGFFGPYVTGWLRDLTGSQNAGIILISVLLAISSVIAILIDRRWRAAGPAVVGPATAKGRVPVEEDRL